MTPKDITTAVSEQLRRRGARFHPEDLEAFMVAAWLQESRRAEPDVWVKRFLTELPRINHLRSLRRRRVVLCWVSWIGACATVGLLLAGGWAYGVVHWPASTLGASAVVLIVGAIILTRFPPADRILRWGLATAVLTLLAGAALVVLLLTRCGV